MDVMEDKVANPPAPPPAPPQPAAPPAPPARSFLQHAKIISLLTLASRVLGVLRESYAAKYFGAGMVSSAFTVAFTIPNLFRRLFGEGALSAAFIPLYSRSLKEQSPDESRRFAAASVNLLIVLLIALTLLGEILLWGLARRGPMRAETLLALKLTAIMLPYVLLICGTAFLGAILQVHRRFGLVAAAPIVLNIALIASTILGARIWDMRYPDQQVRAIYFVAVGVLIAGILQVLMLLPALRAIGFRFQWTTFWTPAVRRMLRLSLPVALGAGVLQLSVLLDRGIAFFLARGVDPHGNLLTHFTLLGQTLPYPMESGAAARLAWAQYLYQFPLGIFAIALATAIFPALSADALDADRQRFRAGLTRGIQVTLWEGLAASAGLILVARPAVQLLFERGQFTSHDTDLVAASLRFFSAAIWAFSLQQILSRAYYALHDTLTPLLMSLLTLVVDLTVKLSLIWRLGESGMAAGTAISFSLQSLAMLYLLQRRVGGLELRRLSIYTLKLLLAAALMTAACLLLQRLPFFPPDTKRTALPRLLLIIAIGAAVYLSAARLLGIRSLDQLLDRNRPVRK